MNSCLLSIVVPIFNIESYVEECVSSLISQRHQNLEIILVNDGSTDKSGEICDRFANKDRRIKVVHQTNKGLVAARKAGVTISHGDYISYVDGDDWVEKETFSELISIATAHDADLVCPGHTENLHGLTEDRIPFFATGIYEKKQLESDVYPQMLCTEQFSQFGITSYVWGKLYKRSRLRRHQLTVNDAIHMGEDASCLYPLLLDCNRVYITGNAGYHYRQRVDSITKSVESDDIEKLKYMYRYLQYVFSRSKHWSLLHSQLNRYFVSLLTTRFDLNQILRTGDSDIPPFRNVTPNSKVAVYGAGTFGQHLVNRVLPTKPLELAMWVDKKHPEYGRHGLQVNAVEKLTSAEFDYVLIAYIDESIGKKTQEHLCKEGIPKSKTRIPQFTTTDINLILGKLGIYQ